MTTAPAAFVLDWRSADADACAAAAASGSEAAVELLGSGGRLLDGLQLESELLEDTPRVRCPECRLGVDSVGSKTADASGECERAASEALPR